MIDPYPFTAHETYTIIYGGTVAHTAWVLLKIAYGYLGHVIHNQRTHIIARHVKDDHNQPLKHCFTGDCGLLSQPK